MRRRLLISGVAFLLLLLATHAFTDQLAARVRTLFNATEYELAQGVIEDQENRGGRLSEELRWWRALLSTDADRFDREASQLMSGKSAQDSLAQAVVLGRAREQFAQGQYLSALENLRALPPTASTRFPEIPLFRAMAAQAVGEVRTARQELESIPRGNPEYSAAQLLLSDLSLRARDGKTALDHAERASDGRDERYRAQALHAQAAAHDLLGDDDAGDELRRRLRREHPNTVEASIEKAPSVTAVQTEAQPDASVSEEEAPPRRSDFALQLGAFHDRSLALRRAEQLVGKIDELRVERDLSASPSWYRVIGGRYPSRSRAESQQRQLREDGIDAVILGPGGGGR